MEITYRRAQQEDWPVIQSLFLEAIASANGTYRADTEREDVVNFIATVYAFLIMNGDAPVGMISYSEKSPGHFYVEELVVGAEHKGQGYGHGAMAWLLNELNHAQKVELVTHPHNSTAIRLYLKHGFHIQEWKDDFYGDGTPRIVMSRQGQ